ncbi:MAG: GNAT family N-acetyltransferase [Candidatus Zixiibacteriota bacterium]
MRRISVVSDIDECQDIWRKAMPQEFLSDLWDVRGAFHRHYNHRPHFVVCHDGGEICGLLPLAFNEETGSLQYFPGETWHGKTWLEQNRIIAGDRYIMKRLLARAGDSYNIRYVRQSGNLLGNSPVVDEVGYFFLPPKYDFDMQKYFEEFSHKTAKRLKRELIEWESRGVSYRYDDMADFETLVAMSLQSYGEDSYFFDPRFLRSFRSLLGLLKARGWLRITTVLVEGRPAAIDMGSTYNGTYTLLAGGTNQEFRGIAKLINIHHMSWSCEKRFDRVDFLCGDFNWKPQFHLTPQPLYLLANDVRAEVAIETVDSLSWKTATAGASVRSM